MFLISTSKLIFVGPGDAIVDRYVSLEIRLCLQCYKDFMIVIINCCWGTHFDSEVLVKWSGDRGVGVVWSFVSLCIIKVLHCITFKSGCSSVFISNEIVLSLTGELRKSNKYPLNSYVRGFSLLAHIASSTFTHVDYRY